MPDSVEDAARVVERLSTELQTRRPGLERRIGYLRGDLGRMPFASDEFREYFEKQFAGFSDNWCLPVAEATAERMKPLGIRLNPRSARADDALYRAWTDAECDRGFAETALVFPSASRSFALVHPNPAEPSLPRVTWEHPEQAIVDYSPLGEARYGMVAWTDGEYDYATLYDGGVGLWRFYRESTDDPALRERWRATDLLGWQPRGEEPYARNPLGRMPLVEFRNRHMLTSDPVSDIQLVMSMQDTVNVVWAYLLNALDYASLPQRVALGAEPPRVPILDENGVEVGSRPVELDKLIRERIMFLSGENVSIGEWKPAALEVFSSVIEHAVEHIAAQTRTPPHYLIAKIVNSSADALTVSEAGLVSKVGERIMFAEPSLREVYRLMALAMGDKRKADRVRFGSVVWKDIQYRSEAQRADALQKKKALGYPLEYLLELDGVPPHDIPRVLAMRRRELEMDPTAKIAAELAATGSPVGDEGAEDGDGE
ncbi:phage portal protein [Prauserella muralis]|uniref:Uncharacterized protein n=1 Tax=Prauserella muralis TaxID=588067 RepID=A0A2V4AKR5_9PSEU|nr:phage portal protein [Prauserella muralis]PXY20888.1 hypothetical protein BAY60_25630 [Prauserella muralis]TWE29929.1 SPP1 Gp6-like portal protein [Prauserella muralis]